MQDVLRIAPNTDEIDRPSTAELFPVVYERLRRMAARRLLGESCGPHTLQPTALVHEAFLRLTKSDPAGGWESQRQFLAAAVESMRRILIDHARRKHCRKRGGDHQRVNVDCELIGAGDEPRGSDLLLSLDEALTRLSAVHDRKAMLVSLKVFSGLTIAEAAQVLGVSVATAERDWTFACVWLKREMADVQTPASGIAA